MPLMQVVSLLASALTTIGPAAQVLHVLRSRSTEGLSVATFGMLTLSTMLSFLMGVQYQIGFALAFAFASLAFNFILMFMIHARLAFGLLALGVAVAALALLGPGAIQAAVLGTQYTELVAFVWGLLSAVTFVPQVLRTRRTRDTRGLSLTNLLLFVAGMALWTVFSWLVQNFSMMFWCGVMLISLLVLLQLKLTQGSQAPAREAA